MQSKKGTCTEILLNTGSGFVVSFAITSFLLPYMVTVGAFGITCIFTVVSLVRSYIWRRIFNKKLVVVKAVK